MFCCNSMLQLSKFNKNASGMLDPRMTSARFSTGFRFSGKHWSETDDAEEDPDSLSMEEDLAGPGLVNPVKSMRNTLSSGQLWSTNVSLSYSYSALNPNQGKKPSGLTHLPHSKSHKTGKSLIVPALI